MTGRGAGWRWALAGAVCGALVAAILVAPARWLASAVAHASGGAVRLDAPRGRVWSGSAVLRFTGGAGSRDETTLPGRVHWRIQPRWLGAQLALAAPCCTPTGPVVMNIAAHWGGASLRWTQGTLHWPAALLVGLGTPWNTIRPEGEITVTSNGLRAAWDKGRLTIAGGADARFSDMASRLSPLRPMGSYRVTLEGGPPIRIHLSTTKGALLLSGQGEWLGTRLRFRGDASAAAGREAQLANLLNVIGERRGTHARIALN